MIGPDLLAVAAGIWSTMCLGMADDDWVQLAHTSANKEGTRYYKRPRTLVSIEHLAALHPMHDLSDPCHAPYGQLPPPLSRMLMLG